MFSQKATKQQFFDFEKKLKNRDSQLFQKSNNRTTPTNTLAFSAFSTYLLWMANKHM
jgi:hypothetical protein